MKRIKYIVLLTLTLVMLLALCLACSKQDESADIIDLAPSSDLNKDKASAKKASSASFEKGSKTEASLQQADIIGEVESIVGNEATMVLMSKGTDGSYTATGDTGVYLIPVGMQVGKGDGDYSSISSGMILGLEIEDDTIVSVEVLRRAS